MLTNFSVSAAFCCLTALSLCTLVAADATATAEAEAQPTQCQQQFSEHYLQVHCELVSRAYRGLPSLNEFRRLPAYHQFLLLKRPAKRFRIPLQEALGDKSSPRSMANSPDNHHESHSSRRNNDSTKQDEIKCSAEREYLTCDSHTFLRLWNQPKPNTLQNKQLARLPEILFLSEERAGLKAAYAQYLSFLLAAGMADTAMSLTRFILICEAIIDQLGSADEQLLVLNNRFELMRNKILEERERLVLPKQTTNSAPSSAVACEHYTLSEFSEIWVCDNVNDTWVYQGIKSE